MLEKLNVHGKFILVFKNYDILTFLYYYGKFGVKIPVWKFICYDEYLTFNIMSPRTQKKAIKI